MHDPAIDGVPAPETRSMLKSWKFWAVMAVIGGLTGLFIFGFNVNPKLVKSPLVGRPALPFAVTDMNTGEQLSLASLRGTPFLLNFWASWCVACRDEAHLLEAAHQRWGKDPSKFRVIGIAVQDQLKDARAFARRFGKTYYLALDNPAGDIGLNYGLYGVPESFYIDATGVIRHKAIGPVTPQELETWIPQMMQDAAKER